MPKFKYLWMFMLKNVVQNKFVIWRLFLHHCQFELKNIKNSKLVHHTLKSRTVVWSCNLKMTNRHYITTKLETLFSKAIQLVWTYQPYCSIKSYWLFFLTQELYWRYEILGHGTCHGIIPLPKLWSWLKVHLTNGLSSRIKR